MKPMWLVCLVLVFLMVGLVAIAAAQAPTPAQRGEYLVKGFGCGDCHTPWKMGPAGPEPDNTRFLSGHPEALVMPPVPALPEGPWVGTYSGTFTAWAGGWGVSFTSNLTPDKDTGLGLWNAETFIATIRTGRYMGKGRPLLPPMPYPAYGTLTDEDLNAIFAYLQTIPAISNKVPAPVPPAGMGGK
jgi:mono/diheme cytochrome c family protein